MTVSPRKRSRSIKLGRVAESRRKSCLFGKASVQFSLSVVICGANQAYNFSFVMCYCWPIYVGRLGYCFRELK